MIPDWFRVDCDIVDNPKIGRLADAIDRDTATAIGHVVAVYARVRQHRPLDGSLVGVSDRTLEQWALWLGARGAFAGAFRAEFAGGDPPAVTGWTERQAPLIKRVLSERDRAKRNREKATPGEGGPDGPTGGAYADSTRTSTRTRSRTVLRQQEQEQEQVAAGFLTDARDVRPTRRGADWHSVPNATMLPNDDAVARADASPPTALAVAAPVAVISADVGAHAPAPAVSIAGVVVGDLAGAAVLFTAAINRGVTDAHGEQPVPVRHDAQLEAAEKILSAGVDREFARDWLYHRARHSDRAHIPRSLRYLADACVDAWRKRVAVALSKQHAAAFVPGADPTAREESRAVVPFAPRPTLTDRLSAASRQNTREALAAHRAAHADPAARDRSA